MEAPTLGKPGRTIKSRDILCIFRRLRNIKDTRRGRALRLSRAGTRFPMPGHSEGLKLGRSLGRGEGMRGSGARGSG